MLLVGWLAGCGSADGSTLEPRPPDEVPSVTSAAPEKGPGPVPSARVGNRADERVHFVPELLVLPGDARAPVQPAATVDGQLQVPENVAARGLVGR